jgi:hypothetical protein
VIHDAEGVGVGGGESGVLEWESVYDEKFYLAAGEMFLYFMLQVLDFDFSRPIAINHFFLLFRESEFRLQLDDTSMGTVLPKGLATAVVGLRTDQGGRVIQFSDSNLRQFGGRPGRPARSRSCSGRYFRVLGQRAHQHPCRSGSFFVLVFLSPPGCATRTRLRRSHHWRRFPAPRFAHP